MNVSTSRFSYSRDDRTFVAEMSDFGRLNVFHQIYPDSCDEGLTLISAKTGAEVDYIVTHTEVDDGDTLFWLLEPTKQSCRWVPAARQTKIKIFND